jgi:hypothetical protein
MGCMVSPGLATVEDTLLSSKFMGRQLPGLTSDTTMHPTIISKHFYVPLGIALLSFSIKLVCMYCLGNVGQKIMLLFTAENPPGRRVVRLRGESRAPEGLLGLKVAVSLWKSVAPGVSGTRVMQKQGVCCVYVFVSVCILRVCACTCLYLHL